MLAAPSRILLALALCAATAMVALPLRDRLDPANAVMVLLLLVFLVALKLGRGPAIVTVFASVALFDVLFVPPHFSIKVAEAQYLVVFAVMLAVGLITSHLTAQLAERKENALTSEREMRQLYELARDLGAVLTVEQAVDRLTAFLSERKLAASVLIDSGLGSAERFATYGRLNLSQEERERAMAAYQQAAVLASEAHWFIPFRGATRVRGVLVAAYRDETRPLLEAVASLAGIAVERLHYAEVAQRSELDAQAEKLRTAILASLSHDLRTPLTSLIGLADSLHADLSAQKVGAGGTACPEAGTAGIIRDQARAMHRMVTNLLDMARLQSGRVQLDRQWQPIDEVVGSSLRLLADLLAGRQLGIDVPADLPLVQFDAVLIERVLCNLLENAAKHSPPGAGIRLSAQVEDDALQVAVCNQGSGFPVHDTTALFDPFVRGEGTLAPGTGIGLAVCRAIVLAHGGTIAAENQAEGACVQFTLPLGTPPEMEGEPT
ncbi:hypothetical protein MASR1M60_01540 [Rhodocyclaceae bacterium]